MALKLDAEEPPVYYQFHPEPLDEEEMIRQMNLIKDLAILEDKSKSDDERREALARIAEHEGLGYESILK